MIKSLLAEDLKLNSKMQDEYDRVKIANLMEMKFPGPACVNKLIELVKEIDEIKDLAKTLRNEKFKGNWKNPYFSLSLTDLSFDLELVKV